MGDIYHSSHDADFFRLNPIGSEFIYGGFHRLAILKFTFSTTQVCAFLLLHQRRSPLPNPLRVLK